MVFSQVFDIPESRQITLPREIPAGRAQVELKVIPFPLKEEEPAEKAVPSKPKMQIPVNSEGKFILTKKVLEELERNSPITQSLCGIVPGMSDLTDEELDEIKYEALAEKHLK